MVTLLNSGDACSEILVVYSGVLLYWQIPFGLLEFFPSCRPLNSVLGHELGNQAAKLMHGTVFFSRSFLFSPAYALLSPEPGGGQGNLAIHTTACICLILIVMNVAKYLFLFAVGFQLGTFPPRGTVGYATFPFRVGFRLFMSSPGPDGSLLEVFTLISLVVWLAFSFNSSFFVSPPPRQAGGSREVFRGGLPYHSAFFVSPPPATPAVRGRLLTVVCLTIVSAFPSITLLRVFPGFIAKPFRGVGALFEEPHLRLMF